MNQDALRRLAESVMPHPDVIVHPGTTRHDVIAPLTGSSNVGIELGVAAGSFSSKLVSSGKFQKVFGVDTYDDYYHHIDEYRETLSRVGLLSNYSLLRMTFEEALPLFPDDFFDFIYVDGFAHTGQEGGQTFANWFPKLKVGGVMAGDDYHPDWPLVMWAVNDFVTSLGLDLHQTEITESHSYNRYPSWFVVKTKDSAARVYRPEAELGRLARMEKERVSAHRKSKEKRRARKALRAKLLGREVQ